MIVDVNGGEDAPSESQLLTEQIDFYRADSEIFDQWLSGLLASDNDEPSPGPTERPGP